MNFKERLRQALRTPNKFGTGGYIENAGGGDQIVYGARHSQGGVTKDSNTELEGGGFDAQGNPKAGEVITTIYDDGGNPQEFYMSYKNGVAQDYLAAKEMAGGQLNQAQKQEFAKENESMNPDGSPTDIAANGGMSKEYGFGGSTWGAMNELTDGNNWAGVGSYLEDGGMKKYFMGGLQSMDDPREREKYGQAVARKSGYTLEDGGIAKYSHGGPHPTDPNAEEGMGVKIGNTYQYKIDYDGGQTKIDKTIDEVQDVVNWLPVTGEVIDAKNAVADAIKGDYFGAALSAAGFFIPVIPGSVLKKGVNRTKDYIRKLPGFQAAWDKGTKALKGTWANPFKGWKGNKNYTTTNKTTSRKGWTKQDYENFAKGKPGGKGGKGTDMINYVDNVRTPWERTKNITKKGLKLASTYSIPYFGYKLATAEDTDPSKEMNYDGLGDGDFSLLTGGNDTVPAVNNVEVEDLGVTDSIPYTAVGDTLNIEGGNWRRLEDAQDGSMNWEQID
tara:strand:- start:1259 stop:2761 length:1503 start_codon:yes stop_codon:yes gene_type:complete